MNRITPYQPQTSSSSATRQAGLIPSTRTCRQGTTPHLASGTSSSCSLPNNLKPKGAANKGKASAADLVGDRSPIKKLQQGRTAADIRAREASMLKCKTQYAVRPKNFQYIDMLNSIIQSNDDYLFSDPNSKLVARITTCRSGEDGDKMELIVIGHEGGRLPDHLDLGAKAAEVAKEPAVLNTAGTLQIKKKESTDKRGAASFEITGWANDSGHLTPDGEEHLNWLTTVICSSELRDHLAEKITITKINKAAGSDVSKSYKVVPKDELLKGTSTNAARFMRAEEQGNWVKGHPSFNNPARQKRSHPASLPLPTDPASADHTSMPPLLRRKLSLPGLH